MQRKDLTHSQEIPESSDDEQDYDSYRRTPFHRAERPKLNRWTLGYEFPAAEATAPYDDERDADEREISLAWSFDPKLMAVRHKLFDDDGYLVPNDECEGMDEVKTSVPWEEDSWADRDYHLEELSSRFERDWADADVEESDRWSDKAHAGSDSDDDDEEGETERPTVLDSEYQHDPE